MSKLIDLTGQRFGRLTVIERAENTKAGKATWLCKCECGNIKVIPAKNLSRGTISCGCLYDGKPLIMRKTHANRLYNIWQGMIYRCTHESASNYLRYGGRGISVCPQCLDSFETFAEWSLENGYTESMEIDRIDNNNNYSPENCRWVSHMKNSQNRNTRTTSTTGFSGIAWRKDIKKYRVTITAHGKRVTIGNYETLDEAVSARNNAETVYWDP